MDAGLAKVVAGATNIINDLDASMGPLKNDMQALLQQLQTSVTNQSALQEKTKTLSTELDAARMSHAEIKAEEDELTSSLKQLQEEVARIQEDLQKERVIFAETETQVRNTKAKIASLEATKQAGSGWTGDQLVKKQELLDAKTSTMAELEEKRRLLSSARAEVAQVASQVEKLQAQKLETEKSIVAMKDEIADAKTRTSTASRAKEVKERELREQQDVLEALRVEYAEKTKQAEEGAKDLTSFQEKLRNNKSELDRDVRKFDKLRLRALTLAEELEGQLKMNQTLAKELHERNENAALHRKEADNMRKEVEKLQKLNDLCNAKIQEAEDKRLTIEAQHHDLRRQIENVDAVCEGERKKNEVKGHAVDDLRREKDVLFRSLAGASDKSKLAQDAVTLQTTLKRNLQTEISGYNTSLKELRTQIEELQRQKDHYTQQSSEAQLAYMTAMEGVKLQELQITALQRKIEEGSSKLKQQQSLFDGVRADRNMYAKNLNEANSEIAEMRRTYKLLSHKIDTIKSDIEVKDVSLIKEHYEHHKVEKEKESLRNDLTRIQKQIQSCEQILTSQESEVSKLNAIIAEADAEKDRQRKEFDAVNAEKELLQTQLVKRDAELAVLYEKLRVQKSSLANGAACYARLAAERDELVARAAAVKGELLVAETQTTDVTKLEAETKLLEADLRAEKTKIRSLTEEMERPLNIHRWRALADRDPERWTLIQRIHSLQKRILDVRDDIRGKEAAISEQEKQYNKLKVTLARQAGPEIHETIASYQSTIKSKAKQLRALEGELASYREKCDEHKRELQRINEEIRLLTDEYIRHMKTLRRQQQGSTQHGHYHSAAAAAGMNDSDLLDVSAELAAAGISPTAENAFPDTHVAAVKNDADRLLAAYADFLGDTELEESKDPART